MSTDTEADQAERERLWAEHDATVKGSVKPEGLDGLIEKLKAAVTYDYDSGSEGYERSADAMWKAALAAFNWAADVVGATGFQASFAALHFYGEAMGIESPFIILKLEDALYPQYDLPGRLAEFIEKNRDWLGDEAKKKLAENGDGIAHPRVLAHWRKLAGEA